MLSLWWWWLIDLLLLILLLLIAVVCGRDFSATGQAIASFAVMEHSVTDQLQYIVDHAGAARVARPQSSLRTLRRSVTPSAETRRQVGRATSFLRALLNYFGGSSKRKMDLMVACLEDDDAAADDSSLYGGGDPSGGGTSDADDDDS